MLKGLIGLRGLSNPMGFAGFRGSLKSFDAGGVDEAVHLATIFLCCSFFLPNQFLMLIDSFTLLISLLAVN